MKTKEELNVLKEKAETENRQRRALTDEEVEQVAGGTGDTPYDHLPPSPTGDVNISQPQEKVETGRRELTDGELEQVSGGADTDSSTAYILKVNVKNAYLRE